MVPVQLPSCACTAASNGQRSVFDPRSSPDQADNTVSASGAKVNLSNVRAIPRPGIQLCQIEWADGKDLSGLPGIPARIRFSLKNAKLYAFWVTPEKSGASHGCVAAGGPGFTGPADTAGIGSRKP